MPGRLRPRSGKRGRLRGVPLGMRWKAVAALGAVVAAGLWFGFYRPASARLAELEREVEVARTQLSKVESDLAFYQSEEGAARLAELAAAAREYEEWLPYNLSRFGMLTVIPPMVEASGMSMKAFNLADDSGQGQPSKELSPVRFQVSATGTVEQLFGLLRRIYDSKPLMTVDSLSMKPAGGGSGGVEAVLTVTVWGSATPPVFPAPPDGPDSGLGGGAPGATTTTAPPEEGVTETTAGPAEGGAAGPTTTTSSTQAG